MCFGIRFYKSCGCPGLSLPACPLVGMTPPPGSLLRKQGKLVQVCYSQQIGKIQIPHFAPPAASRISVKTLCPVAWCISAPCFSSPRQGARVLLIDSDCRKCFCVTFGKSNKTPCCRWLRSAPARWQNRQKKK